MYIGIIGRICRSRSLLTVSTVSPVDLSHSLHVLQTGHLKYSNSTAFLFSALSTTNISIPLFCVRLRRLLPTRFITRRQKSTDRCPIRACPISTKKQLQKGQRYIPLRTHCNHPYPTEIVISQLSVNDRRPRFFSCTF